MERITLTKETANDLYYAIADYLREFPVAGYGTHIENFQYNGKEWKVAITRNSTSD